MTKEMITMIARVIIEVKYVGPSYGVSHLRKVMGL